MIAGISTEKFDFPANKEVIFELDTGSFLKSRGAQSAHGELVLAGGKISAQLEKKGKKVGQDIIISKSKKQLESVFSVQIPTNNQFAPGKYQLKITLTAGGETRNLEQDFTWGVLAINPDQAVYEPNETANLSMAVLDDEGSVICDAKVNLEITNPQNEIKILSTDSGAISVSEECEEKNYTEMPDYAAEYLLAGEGEYLLHLTAETENGTREMDDKIVVNADEPYFIQRIGPTRIYPPATYEMQVKITAQADFTGQIQDFVPASFDVSESADYTVETKDGQKIVSWNTSILAGKSEILTYQFQAPDISPEFYLLGPLETTTQPSVVAYTEPRQWQIAADTLPTYVNAGAVASGAGAITPAFPASIAANDILLLFIETENEAASVATAGSCTTWTQVADSPQGTGTASAADAVRLTAFWCRYGGSGTTGPTTNDSGDHQLARIIAVHGVSTAANPIDVTSGSTEASNTDTTGVIPGDTTTGRDRYVVTAIATALPDTNGTAGFASFANANLANFAEKTDNTTNAGTGGGLGIAAGEKAATGTYGSTTVTTSSNTAKAYMTIALKPAGITISGTAYTSEAKGANVVTNGTTIGLSVNGATKTTTTTTSGAFTFTDVVIAANETVALFIDDSASYEGSLVTQAADATTNITGLEMYTNKVVLRHETAGPMTNALLATADNYGDTDIHYTNPSGSAITFEEGFELWIDASKTYTPGAEVTAYDVDLNGTLVPEANTINVAGSLDFTGGTFTKGSSTINLNGTTASETITMDSEEFYNLTVAGGVIPTSTSFVVTTSGAEDTSAGTSPWTSPTNIESDDASYASAEDYNLGVDTYYLTATGFDFSSIPEGATIYGIEVKVEKYGAYDGAGAMPTDAEVALIVAGAIDGDNKADTFTDWPGSATGTTYGASDDLWNVTGWGEDPLPTPYQCITDPATYGDFGVAIRAILNGGGDDPSNTSYAYVDYIAIKVYYSSALSADWTLQDNLVVTNTLTMTSGTLTAGANTITTKDYTQNGGTLSAPSTTMNVSANFANNGGTFTHNSGEVVLTGLGASTQTISGDTTFHDLTSTATAARTITFTAGTTQTIEGTWTVDGDPGELITLNSSSTPSTWSIDPTGWAVDYVNVTDSINLAATPINPAHYEPTNNPDNNTNWFSASANTAPTNDSLTFTNPYSSNIAIADNSTEWTFRALVTDDDGSTDLDYVELRLANSADSSQPYDSIKFRWTEATDSFSEQADTQDAFTLTSTNANSNATGDQWTLDFKFKIDSDFLAKDTNYAAELYTIDEAADSDNDNYADKYQVTGLSISLDVDNATISLGNLLPGSIATGTTIATVDTNYANGYSLGASDGVAGTNSCLLHTDTTTRITDYAGTIATPTVWDGTGLGITVWAGDTAPEAKWCNDICSAESDPDNKYAGVPETAATIHAKTGAPTLSDTTSIGYKLVVPNTQKTGDYSGNITYTATGVLP